MKHLISQKGTSAVEFALILPVLIILIFGIIEFSILMYNQQVITNASREGARTGIVQETGAPSPPRLQPYGGDCAANPPQSVQCVVNKYARTHLFTFGAANDPVTVVTGYAANAAYGTYLTVTVTYNYGFLVLSRFVPLGGPTKTLRATTVMRYE